MKRTQPQPKWTEPDWFDKLVEFIWEGLIWAFQSIVSATNWMSLTLFIAFLFTALGFGLTATRLEIARLMLNSLTSTCGVRI